MFSRPLLKQIIHSNLKLFMIFAGVQALLIAILMLVYPSSFGTLTVFSGRHFFELLAPIFTMIYLIITGNRMIAGQVDKGSLSYTLSTPITRTQVTFTNALFLAGSLVLMYAVIAVVGVVVAAVAQPGLLDNAALFRLSLGEFSLQFTISGIVFCSSCIFNRTSRAMIFGVGLPVLFFASNIIAGITEDLSFFKYFSLFSLVNTQSVIDGLSYALGFIVLIVIGVLLYIVGMKVFKEKDLPL
jgi:ABC-2 type transport system permease protein